MDEFWTAASLIIPLYLFAFQISRRISEEHEKSMRYFLGIALKLGLSEKDAKEAINLYINDKRKD